MLKFYGILSISAQTTYAYHPFPFSLIRLLGLAFSDAKQQVAAVECFRLACQIEPGNEELKELFGKSLKSSLNQDADNGVPLVAATQKGGLVV